MPSRAAPAEFAILGLLDLETGSGHGYDLARNFAEGRVLADVLHLEPGMLYHHLKKLEKRGWVTSETELQSTRPPRQIYAMTERGKNELHHWMSEPVRHTREIRLEFLIKLYFARRTDPGLAERLIEEQLDASSDWMRALEQQRVRLGRQDAHDPDHAFTAAVCELRLAQTRAAIDWLRSL